MGTLSLAFVHNGSAHLFQLHRQFGGEQPPVQLLTISTYVGKVLVLGLGVTCPKNHILGPGPMVAWPTEAAAAETAQPLPAAVLEQEDVCTSNQKAQQNIFFLEVTGQLQSCEGSSQ